MEIGKIIKDVRKSKDMTQEDLAKIFYVSRQLISKWENGKSFPDLEQLVKISDLFELSLDELLRGDKKMIKNLNFNVKKKTLTYIIILFLISTILGILSFYWTQKRVNLTSEDIEIVSVEKKIIPEKKVYSLKEKKEITLPQDVSYRIKYRIKKPFIKINNAHVFGTLNPEDPNIYVDIQVFNSFFSNKKNNDLIIPAISSSLTEGTQIDDIEYYQQNNMNKSIRLLDVERFNTNTPQINISQLILDKSNL